MKNLALQTFNVSKKYGNIQFFKFPHHNITPDTLTISEEFQVQSDDSTFLYETVLKTDLGY